MRIAVFGGGYAGLGVARRLEESLPEGVEVILVDDSGEHVVRHLLHRGIRHPAELEHVRLPLDRLLDRATIRERRVESLDHDAGVATLAGGESLAYDLGVVTLGADPNFHGLAGAQTHATPLHRPADVETIRARFADVLEESGRVVVCGGGLTGVQTAGELAALAREHNAENVDVILLEQADAVPPGFDERLQNAVVDALERIDVDVRTETTITGADADAITIADGEPVPYDQFVWAGGIQGSTAQGSDRPTVPATLRLAENAFGLGDAVRVIDADGERVPPTAHAAIRQARTAATNVTRVVERRLTGGDGFDPRLERYRYDEAGWLVSVGDDAVAKIGPKLLTGNAATTAKTAVGAGYLTSIGTAENAVAHVRDAIDSESCEGLTRNRARQ